MVDTQHSKYKPVSFIWLFLFWILAALLYLPAYRYGFMLDFLDTLEMYDRLSFTDFINREGVENRSLYQVTQTLLYSLISVFGHRPAPWFLLFTFLHSWVGWMTLNFFNRLFLKMDFKPAFTTAVAGTILFLVNPVQSEVLIWKAAFHYYLAVLIIFSILSWTFSYLETGARKYAWRIAILYLISTFTLELFYLTPAFVCVLICALALTRKITATGARRSLLFIFVPLVALWACHLLIYHFMYGKWIAHYEVKLEDSFTFIHIFSRLGKYLMHILGMEYFWAEHWRNKYYQLTDKLLFVLALAVPFIAIIAVGIARWNKWKPAMRIVVTLFIMMLFSFAMIFPLWFNNLQLMRNDRYYYLPSIFVLMLLSVLINTLLKHSNWGKVAMFSFFFLYTWGTLKIAFMTRNASKVFYGVLDNFYAYNSPTVLLLNLPNNYEGIGMIPAREHGYFNDHLKVLKHGAAYGKIYDVSSYNVTSTWDGAHVTLLDSNKLHVRLNQWGTWWWYDSKGAVPYENDVYKIEFNEWGDMLVTLKQNPNSMTILYQVGTQWKQVDMSKPGVEQW